MTRQARRLDVRAPFSLAEFRNRYGLDVAVLAFCTLAALPLAFAPILALDWANHVWFAAYVTQSLKTDWGVPSFLNASGLVGNPVLTFYGTPLYTALAPFTTIFGPDLGLRLAVLVALIGPALATVRSFLALGAGRLAAGCLTICLSISVYQLTNIYTRGAATEFFAYQLILLGVVLLLTALVSHARPSTGGTMILGAASLVLGVLTHPPSFYLAILFLGLPGAVLAVRFRRALAAALHGRPLIAALLATLFIAPVLWVGIAASAAPELGVSRPGTSNLHYFPWSIDHWLARLWPFPIDLRVLIEGFNLVSTPFLAAPMNTIALFLLVPVGLALLRAHAAASRRNLALPLFACAAAISIAAPLLLSLPLVPVEPSIAPDGTPIQGVVHADPQSPTGAMLGPVQFAYRLVNIVNLAIIVAVLGLCSFETLTSGDTLAGRRFGLPKSLLIAAAALAIAVVGTKVLEVYLEFVLLPRAAQQLTPLAAPAWPAHGIRGWMSPRKVESTRQEMLDPERIPSTQYGLALYVMPSLYPPYTASPERQEVNVKLAIKDRSRARAKVKCSRPCALLTNLLASRFVTVRVDGRIPAPDRLALREDYSNGATMVIFADPGTHRLSVTLGSWQTAALSWAILWLVFVFWAGAIFVCLNALRRAAAQK